MKEEMTKAERLIAESRVEVDRARQRAQEAETALEDVTLDRDRLAAERSRLSLELIEANRTIDTLARKLFNANQRKLREASPLSLIERIFGRIS